MQRPTTDILAGAPTTPDEFLAWSATLGPEYEGYKVELSDGRVTKMMVNVSRAHARICTSIMRLLLVKLDASAYDISVADFGVRTPKGIRSPDIMVEPAGIDLAERASEQPIFIAEVLSPTTTSVDFLEKMPEYTSISSLQTYLICSQDEPIVWLMARGVDGAWPKLPEEITGTDAVVPIAGLNIVLPMSEIYRGIPSPPRV